jgi:shikimate dehydrogenase
LVYLEKRKEYDRGVLDVPRTLSPGLEEISTNTSFFYLIGDPVEQSLSPVMHNAAFAHMVINAVYETLNVGPSEESLRKLVEGLKRRKSCVGFNITIPHKMSIISFLDKVDPEAELLGAVNTVVADHRKYPDTKLVGYNTDIFGFEQCLRKIGIGLGQDNHQSGKEIRKAIVFGAGGAARACLFSLLKTSAREIYIANRNFSKASHLVEDFLAKDPKINPRNSSRLIKAIQFDESSLYEILTRKGNDEKEDSVLAVNATSASLLSNAFPHEIAELVTGKDSGISAFVDVNYPKTKEEENEFSERIRSDGQKSSLRFVNGLLMLVEQAALSFKLWTGVEAPKELMLDVAKKELENRQAGTKFAGNIRKSKS